MIRVRVIATCLLLLLLPSFTPAQDKAAPEKVRIAIATSSMAFLVPFVAKDRGFYLKHGSEVELIVMRPNIAMAALLGGDIDYAELIGSIISPRRATCPYGRFRPASKRHSSASSGKTNSKPSKTSKAW